MNKSDAERFEKWKQEYAPSDSGEDYDLLAAFRADVVPDASGHWPDTYKRPNHPTFSEESVYAVGPDAAKAGRWEGDKFVPPCDGPGGKQDSELPHTCKNTRLMRTGKLLALSAKTGCIVIAGMTVMPVALAEMAPPNLRLHTAIIAITGTAEFTLV